MKKGLSILVSSIAILGLTLILSGVLVSQAAPSEKQQGPKREAPKPIPATNIEVVKKVFSEDVGKGKGKPSPPSKTGSAATGILGAPATGNKYAVIIGICDYPGTNLDLCQSDGDSLHMYKALIELYGYKPENIKLFKDDGGTTGPNLGSVAYSIPTREKIYNAIMDIKGHAISGDEVVFFFSGHGTKGTAMDGDSELTDEGIVVWNTEANTENNITYIWDGELRNWFDGFATTRIAFVFDSCLAGGMNDVASVGRVVSMATGETQSAYVYSTAGEDVDGNGIQDGEGVFTRYFVNEGMLQGLADKYDHDKDGVQPERKDVVIEEAFDYAKAKANASSYLKVRQKPVISDNFPNDLLL
ncbi:MAG: caspase family protein [Patescibacteria group bacterium]|nr:caspase family protein [Patescibacteria group bacterium]